MVSKELFEKIQTLDQAYAEKWGHTLDYRLATKKMSPEKLVAALERILETGERLGL